MSMWGRDNLRGAYVNVVDRIKNAYFFFVGQNVSNEMVVPAPTPTPQSNPIIGPVSNALTMLIDFSCRLIIVYQQFINNFLLLAVLCMI